MFADIEIPKPLYDYWPTICVCIAVGYGFADVPLVTCGMLLYAGWVWTRRLIFQEKHHAIPTDQSRT